MTTSIPGYRVIGPLAYVGKPGCENATCTHIMLGHREDGTERSAK